MKDLRLRPPLRSDLDRVHEWGSDAETCRYQPWGPNSRTDSERFLDEAVATWELPVESRSRFVWVIEDGEAGVVGICELKVRAAEQLGEISYVVHPAHRRLGVAKWAALSLIDYGFDTLGLRRIFATCDPRNTPSGAVLRAVGMTYQRRELRTMQVRGRWRDSDVFSIEPSDE
jgi:[ribosomal protein S5]-alanine N-acetyltransferase